MYPDNTQSTLAYSFNIRIQGCPDPPAGRRSGADQAQARAALNARAMACRDPVKHRCNRRYPGRPGALRGECRVLPLAAFPGKPLAHGVHHLDHVTPGDTDK